MRSRRMPLGRSFQVGGNKLIKLKSSEPPVAFCIELVHVTRIFGLFVSYGSVESKHKGIVGVGSCLLGSQGEFMLHPLICNALGSDLSYSKDFAAARLEGSSEGALVRTLHVEGSRVLLRTNIDTPEARVRETRSALARNTNGGWESRGKRACEVLEGQARTTDSRPSIQVGRVSGASLEGSIADQLGV